MPRDVPHNRTNKRYHVGNWNTGRTLCGKEYAFVVWDEPAYWLTQERSNAYSGRLPKCEACAEHPDIALLILGDVP